MVSRRLENLWEQLRGKKPHFPHFLDEVRLTGFRGFDNLGVRFDYPVSVIAGGNASGKTTVLFAVACAYKVPGAGYWDFRPATLFPNYRPTHGNRRDDVAKTEFNYEFSTPSGRLSMTWRRGKYWNQSFFGRTGAEQPERAVYLRTLTTLSNPTEVRSVLQMSRLDSAPEELPLTAYQITFAQSLLPFNYTEVVDLTRGKKKLLFATQTSGTAYSEFHMAAGERAILRISQEVAQLKGAIVLIDEVEAGLHPRVQSELMLQLQRLALLNDTQIIVTSHSPVILDSVPTNARIFLDRRSDGMVQLLPPYRDVIQDALYAQSEDRLNVLCEDETGESILRGIIDYIASTELITHETIRVGRDTGAGEFPAHVTAIRKFASLDNFVFVLDGDRRSSGVTQRMQDNAGGGSLSILHLPSQEAPEVWIWEKLRNSCDSFAPELGTTPEGLSIDIQRLDDSYALASDSQSVVAKEKLYELSERLKRTTSDICRYVGRKEAENSKSDLLPLVQELKVVLARWRSTNN